MAEPLAALGTDPNALAYRSALLPLGRTNAGNVTWAVPQAVLSALGAAQFPGQVYRGEVGVYDPATGHVSEEAIGKAADIAGIAMTGGLGGTAKKAGETVLGAGPIRAYHGSPHAFDRFDISKIGTGEGAQVYGHGLYFAENEAVAKTYRDTISPMIFKADGAPITDDAGRMFAESQHRNGTNLDEVIAGLRNDMKGQPAAPDDPTAQMMREYLKRAEEIRAAKIEAVPTGHMYEVGIRVDPTMMLDWDVPIARQGADVRRFADRVGVSGATAKGEDLITGLVRRGYDPAEASADLRRAGIPGVRYLDKGSRDALEGTRNYVTFSDDIVSVLRRYGLAGAAGAGGALATLGSPDTAQATPQAPLSRLGR